MLLPSSDKTTYCQCHITTQTEQRHQSKNDVTRDLVTPELIYILRGQPIKINHTVSDSELYVCSFTHSILFLKSILTFCEKKKSSDQEEFVWAVKGQNKFWNRILFQLIAGGYYRSDTLEKLKRQLKQITLFWNLIKLLIYWSLRTSSI